MANSDVDVLSAPWYTRLFRHAVSWLPVPSSWRGADPVESRAVRMKSELSKASNAPILLKDCIQTAFIYDQFVALANPASPLYHNLQHVAELAFDACIGMLKYWRWLVEKATSNASNDFAEQDVNMDSALLQAVTDTLEYVSSCPGCRHSYVQLNRDLGA